MVDVLIIIPEITKGMKSLGSKALLRIKNSITVLEYQINELRKTYPRSTIFVGTGFESEKIKKIFSSYKNIQFIENHNYNETNQSKLISLFANQYTGNRDILVISNGILFKNNVFVSNSDNSKIFLIDKPKNNFNIGCNDTENVNYLFYDLPIKWTECVLFNKNTLDYIKILCKDYNTDQMYLFELINLLMDKYHISFSKHMIVKKNIMKINTIKDIPIAKLFI